jgi:LemA protein
LKNLPLLIVIAVVVLLALWGVGQYNRLITLEQGVKMQWAQVDNQLLRRDNLIPNLVGTVKGIAGQEQKVFGAIADARARMSGARASGSVNDQIGAAHEMDSALGRLLVVVENYPQLQSAGNFRDLQAQLEGTENRIALERKRYNEQVMEYNVTVKRFPVMLFANALGFREKPSYPVPEESKKVPQVQF